MRPKHDLAETIRAAYTQADLAQFGDLLADDVRWGDDDHPNRCRTREDVLRTFATWIGEGVTAEVIDVESGPFGVSCRLRVRWSKQADRARVVDFFHVLLIRDGLIREIRRFDDAESATRAISSV